MTRRICSELKFFPAGMVGGTWAGAAPSSLPSDPTSCWLPLDMELLHRQVLTLQTQRVLLGMWADRDWDTWVSPRRVAPHSRLLLTASLSSTEKRRKASAWQRNLGYPLAMLCLLVLTVGIPALVGVGSSRHQVL